MKNIHLSQIETSNYFSDIYSKNISFENMPWITWAVDIDLLNNVINWKFNNPLKIFEIWCWIWTESIFLSKIGHKLTSIDLSKDILKLAFMNSNIYWVNIDFKEFDITKNIENQFDLGIYDLVIDRACFHHILPENRLIYMSNVSKLLKSNWELYIRWFSDKMSPSISWDGPFRLSENDFYETFNDLFWNIKINYYKNIPAPEKNKKEQIWISFNASKI